MNASDSFRSFIAAYGILVRAILAVEAAAGRLELWGQGRLGRLRKVFQVEQVRWLNPWTGFVLFFLLLLTRSYYWIVQPQFFIEDGPEFYGTAFNLGSRSLLQIYMGYYHTVPRLIALSASQLPPRYGPLLMELSALAIQAAVAAFLLSNRLREQIPSVALRAILGLLIVGYPYSNELFGNVAHSQWYLAIGTATILCATPDRSVLSRACDYGIVLITSVTGPFAIVLAPLAWWVGHGNRHRQGLALVLTAAAVLTVVSIVTHPRFSVHGRPRFSLFERMISNQVVIGSTLGYSHLRQVGYEPFFDLAEFAYALFGLGLIGFAFKKGPLWVRAMAVLGLFTLATCLYGGGNWILLGSAGVAERYFLFLGIVFICGCAMASLAAKWAVLRWGFRFVVLCTIIGVAINWVYAPPFSEFDYARQIAAYDRLRPGQSLKILTPIDRKSPSTHWVVTLRKR